MSNTKYPKSLFVNLTASGRNNSMLFIRKVCTVNDHIIWEIKVNREGISPVTGVKIVSNEALESSIIKTKTFITYWDKLNTCDECYQLIDVIKMKHCLCQDSSHTMKQYKPYNKYDEPNDEKIQIAFQWLDKQNVNQSLFGYVQNIQTYKCDLIITVKSPLSYYLCPYQSFKYCNENCFYIYDDLNDYFKRDKVKMKITKDMISKIPTCLNFWQITLYQFK